MTLGSVGEEGRSFLPDLAQADTNASVSAFIGGVIFNIANLLLVAAIAYGLGQGATLVAALWGVFIWKEFAGADKRTNLLIGLMFLAFIVGLGLIIFARF